MAKLVWDEASKRLYETGIEQPALYLNVKGEYPKGVAWNGFTGLSQNPSGGEPTALYANDTKYAELLSNEEFGATITAYTYPDEFLKCDGSAELVTGVSVGQQARSTFGLAYKTLIGNDTEGTAHGYKLHLVYGAKAKPSQKDYKSVNDNPEAIEFSWEITTTPVAVAGLKPTAHLEIDSTKVDSVKLKKLEDIIYGTTEPMVEARLPLPDEVKSVLTAA